MSGNRRARLLVGARGDGARSTLVALVSTLVVGTLLVLFVTRSPGWDAVRAGFFDGAIFRTSLPEIAGAFLLNVKIFSIVEAIVLVAALLLAVVRSLPGPAFFPLRMLAIAYCDVFRGIPTILLILLLGFGVPGLQIDGAPTSPVFWSIVALSLVYTAYVSEVYRAGIDSVHPSQDAAARSLGLTRAQSLRFVVVPQAVRRVIPPLLNDFIGLQKDTALVSILGAVESLRQAQIDTAATFNFTPYLAVALLFLVITIPLTRLTDWLIARDRRRRLAGGVR